MVGSDEHGGSEANQADKAELSKSVLGVISSGQWRSALFTTYTLSLTYVESHLLPALRRSGCESLTILADTSGYRDSLMEQRSQGVGRDYSVVPVRSLSGIFHAKLVYLEAKDGEDLLLVGSGNVTYPGHGGNIEVLEVLRPSTSPSAFMQCAEFFQALARSNKVQIPDVGALEKAVFRMLSVSKASTYEDKAQFVHSLFISGKQQMIDAANQIGGKWHELLVLSPYHHPTAKPILELAKSLGVNTLIAGVPARKGEPSAFPFDEVRSRFPNLQLVSPLAGPKQRNLHAKWFEARGDSGVLVLTGSFNATVTSFGSSDNVECGVLRLLPEPTGVWEEAVEPEYQPGEFPARQDARRPCLFAVLMDSTRLQCCLLASTTEGVWAFTLESADEVLLNTEVLVPADGKFELALSLIDLDRRGTLQLVATRDGVVARGWVQVAQVLRMEARQRRLLDAVSRMSHGSDTPQDVQLLLDILAQEASRTIQTNVLPDSRSGKAVCGGAFYEVTGAQFAAMAANEATSSTGRHSLLDALNAGAQGLDLLDALIAALLPRLGRPRAKEDDDQPNERVDPFVRRHSGGEKVVHDDPHRKRQVEQVYEELQKRLEEMNSLLLRQPTSAVALEKGKLRLLMVWLGTVLLHKVGVLNDPDGALAFLSGTWLRETCNVRLDWEDKEWVSRHVCGVAAVWAYELQSKAGACLALLPTTRPTDDVTQAMDQVRELRRRVRAFFASKSSLDEMTRMAKLWLEDARAAALVGEQVDEALMALRAILSSPSERQVVMNALANGVESQKAELATFSAKLEALVVKAVDAARAQSPKSSFVDLHTLRRCPTGRCDSQYLDAVKGGGWALTSEVRWRLNKFGVYQCRCGHFLIAREAA